ncbi:helix-turn-helix domain-containing protein [Deinococcus arcticus]|uniref:Transcriptional regulator n=1 Tax=Deinococcus arcticus TaxID=2136176 RepID=A0A2T3W4Y2_9DEIO|nr:helix-turn-helix transcriptional regulator [Deinococcus arcticus]PTA66929.1 transcriptional regulator [Deinococcus arcticus]
MKKGASSEIEFEKSSGNIFADLGLDNPGESLIQADLALAIAREVRERAWTQAQAAAVMGVSQSDVSNIVRGKLKGFSIERLTRLLGFLDCEVEVVVRSRHADVQFEVSTSTENVLRRSPPNIPFIPPIPVQVIVDPCPPLPKVRNG